VEGSEVAPLPLTDGFFTKVIDLNQGHHNSGFITVASQARLTATATADITNVSTGVRRMTCRLALFPQPGNPQQPFGEAAEDTLGSGQQMTSPMTASVDVVAGTYNVAVQCGSSGGTFGGAGDTEYVKGNLSVIATGR
jgi:hypothetical protein